MSCCTLNATSLTMCAMSGTQAANAGCRSSAWHERDGRSSLSLGSALISSAVGAIREWPEVAIAAWADADDAAVEAAEVAAAVAAAVEAAMVAVVAAVLACAAPPVTGGSPTAAGVVGAA